MKALLVPVASALRSLSPEEIALLLTIGLVLGIFPMCGIPTVLCIMATRVARVNFPALQIVNQLSWPLQIAVLAPLARLGSKIIASSNEFTGTVGSRLGTAVLQAVAGWFCICIPLGLFLYFSLLCILRRSGTVNTVEANLPA